ncbi:MAG: hypoxanthine phosphoribosyltransferase [Dehalococcoidia bacterium]|nr:hypoxanthine phosphoribosyltransferase [Dehalococcoidia bacterium]
MARRSPAKRSATAAKPVPPVAVVRGARVQFAHESEAEFARILDFYGISWLYEPRSFPLRWEGERILEAFTPDFFLPDLNLYLELTTLKQKLITEKNRKVRQLRELYPQVNVKLLNKKDYLRLLAKYGYGPPDAKKLPDIDRVLITASQIERRVGELGAQITRDYSGQAPMVVGVLKGVFFFMADLLRHISLPVSADFMAISSYEGDSGGAVTILKDLDLDISGQHVLLVEDIVDTGMTLNRILERLWSHRPASLKVCALLDKRARRLVDVRLDYIGFEIPDEFVVGYGLDYRQRYRNLPFIGILKHELLS